MKFNRKFLRLLFLLFPLNHGAKAGVIPTGEYKPIGREYSTCGRMTLSAVQNQYPGFTLTIDRSHPRTDEDTGTEILVRDVRYYPFSNLGNVIPLGIWDKRFVSENDGCFILVQEVSSRDPSDYGLIEHFRVCFDEHSGELTADFIRSENACKYRQ